MDSQQWVNDHLMSSMLYQVIGLCDAKAGVAYVLLDLATSGLHEDPPAACHEALRRLDEVHLIFFHHDVEIT